MGRAVKRQMNSFRWWEVRRLFQAATAAGIKTDSIGQAERKLLPTLYDKK